MKRASPDFIEQAAVARVGHYILERKIGQGGMADVFLARDEASDDDHPLHVVIKRIRPQHGKSPRFQEMFVREGTVLLGLHHPNIVRLIELSEDNGEYFLALEYLDGLTLRDVVERWWHARRTVPIESLMRVWMDVTLGLHHAHNFADASGKPCNLVHRDISPDNLFLTSSGSTKLLDFGIAKRDGVDVLTQAGEIKGKIPYMSPEALQGLPLDRRADVWSLGITMYWSLCGVRPFDGTSDLHTMKGILDDEPPRVRVHNPLVPMALEDVVMRCLEKDRQHRTATAMDVHLALAKLLTALPRTAPSPLGILDEAKSIVGVSYEVRPVATAAAPMVVWPREVEAPALRETVRRQLPGDITAPPSLAPGPLDPNATEVMALPAINAVDSDGPTQTRTRPALPEPLADARLFDVDRASQSMLSPSLKALSAAAAPMPPPLPEDSGSHGLVNAPTVRVAIPLSPADVVKVKRPPRSTTWAWLVGGVLLVVALAFWQRGPLLSRLRDENARPLQDASVSAIVDAGVVAAPVDAGVAAAQAADAGVVHVAAVDAGVVVPADTGPVPVRVTGPEHITWQTEAGDVLGHGTATLEWQDRKANAVLLARDDETGCVSRTTLDDSGEVRYDALPRGRLMVRGKKGTEVWVGQNKIATLPMAKPTTLPAGQCSVRLKHKRNERSEAVTIRQNRTTLLR